MTDSPSLTSPVATSGTVRTGIAGHTGYVGEELIRLLRRHPGVNSFLVDSSHPEATASSFLGQYSEKAVLEARQALSRPILDSQNLPHLTLEEALDSRLDVVFLATPVETSMDWVPRFLERNVRVIDLSGAFRIENPTCFERFYGVVHPYPNLLRDAVYGLPELAREKIRNARLVANPGCYATAAILALNPPCEGGLVDQDAGVVCDAKTGVSGAGKKPRSSTHFCSVIENVSVYGAISHRHIGEIIQITGLGEANLTFATQILPVRRGILMTVYFRLPAGRKASELVECWEQAYGNSPFVEIYPEGAFPSLTAVANTNRCLIGYATAELGRRVLAVVALDNLLKGAAGQAVQNMNLMFGCNEATGLEFAV